MASTTAPPTLRLTKPLGGTKLSSRRPGSHVNDTQRHACGEKGKAQAFGSHHGAPRRALGQGVDEVKRKRPATLCLAWGEAEQDWTNGGDGDQEMDAVQ